MGKITVLPAQEAQKIAAGEVVERPANVIKELVENALDAGATQIKLAVKDGGKQQIKIVDNGSGMSLEDAQMCIQNHATSKITSVNDLDSIATFGFRGEALASIASVSKMTITTKERTVAQGWQLTIENGAVIATNEVGCNAGTTIEISDIFYNVPARRKFLKKRETEWRIISQLVNAFALANTNCCFTVLHDDKQLIHYPATTTLQERATQVLENSLAHNLVACSTRESTMGLSATGVIARPTYNRYDRDQIVVFVNNRWIKNFKLSQSIIKGYANILPPRRYPIACIFVTIDPLMIDVNIHPRKEEVQFLHPRKVEIALELMVKQALETCAATDLGAHTANHLTAQHTPAENTKYHGQSSTGSLPRPGWSFGTPLQNTTPTSNLHVASEQPKPHVITQPSKPVAQEKLPGKTVQKQESFAAKATNTDYDYQLIGQIHNCYIIIENDDGMVMIDQHAAHERILYEEFALRFDDVAVAELMFPQLITLSHADCTLLEPHLPFFAQHGILLEPFSETQMTVKALPVHLKNVDIADLVKAALGWISELQSIDEVEFLKKMNDNLRSMMACKAAIKAGDKLDNQQMHELIKKIHNTPNRTTCPHGRPTSWRLSVNEIERKFQRKL